MTYAPSDNFSYGGYHSSKRSPKIRFCSAFPFVANCRRSDCTFAHTREEISTPLLSLSEENQEKSSMTDDFFINKFKTLWCPIGVQHDWQICAYAHNYQDARRHPSIGYGPKPCPSWKRKETTLEYAQRCPNGVRCPFSHGAKEQLYHPWYFKTVTCQDWQNARCPRTSLCAFYHKNAEQRPKHANDKLFNYKEILTEEAIHGNLQPDFLASPFRTLGNGASNMSEEHWNGYTGNTSTSWDHGTWIVGGPTPTTTTAGDSDEANSAVSSAVSDKPSSVAPPPPPQWGRGERKGKGKRNGGRGNANALDTVIPPSPHRAGNVEKAAAPGVGGKAGTAGGVASANANAVIDGPRPGLAGGMAEVNVWGGVPNFYDPALNTAPPQAMWNMQHIGGGNDTEMAKGMPRMFEGAVPRMQGENMPVLWDSDVPVNTPWAPMVPASPFGWGANVAPFHFAATSAVNDNILNGMRSPQDSPLNSPRGPFSAGHHMMIPVPCHSGPGFDAVTYTPRSDASGRQYNHVDTPPYEEGMPTHNGFIHFKDELGDGSTEFEQFRGHQYVGSAGRRPRASSH